MCGTPNKLEEVFCSKCGARLVPLTAAPAAEKIQPTTPIKGLSLPAKPSEPAEPPAVPTDLTQSQEPEPKNWLERLRSAAPADEEAPAQPESPAEPAPVEEASETPSWLKRLRQAPPPEEAAAEEPSPAASAEEKPAELPGWLTTASAQKDQGQEPSPTEEAPGWLKRLPTASEQPSVEPAQPSLQPAAEEPISPATESEIPDWLKNLAPASVQENVAPPAEPALPQPAAEQPPFEPTPSTPAPTTEPVPSWLASIGEEPAPATTEEAKPGEQLIEELEAKQSAFEPAEQVEVPAWLTESETPEEVEAEDIPDWLRTTQPVKPSAAPAAVETAQVPAWIAALKPKTAEPELENEPVETAGPLAGLRGVLPLALAIAEPHAVKPDFLTAQPAGHGRFFESILAAPAVEAAPVAKKKSPRVWTMRPWIYLLLALAAIIPFLLPSDWASIPLPDIKSPAGQFYDKLQQLPAGSTVLMSFDYDPGQAGEMNLQAQAIVRQLIRNRIKIVAMSTIATGPQMAQNILNNATRGNSNYVYGTNYLNLGFLPSEAGLAQLVAGGFPATAKDAQGQDQPLTSFPIAANVKALRDFKLVIELAGSDDPLQHWMEQVQPRAGVPIIAGISASAEPKANAYFSAKQLDAFISGLVGAAEYEMLSNQPGLALISVNVQSVALAVLVLLIIIGNIVYWVQGSRRTQGKA